MTRKAKKRRRKILWAYAQLYGPDALSAYAVTTRKRLLRTFERLLEEREALRPPQPRGTSGTLGTSLGILSQPLHHEDS